MAHNKWPWKKPNSEKKKGKTTARKTKIGYSF
ncbi:hypothetical protein CCACVL1_16824 [Corchorus capsularis]|uniref:Uncharacterized protein n=1 Tax=Corchorus capsularis TaxID=210143 RepID=A0A1R3HVG7_COCAP|nr:hypothetical protein CCACVL1_16823 [Corchorus capsularis]OMO74333.1 hypothetical protein CCACVL1_16824 [Corchorus capsularis]